ncbi:hypothetical protein SDC9_147305 [bioreactor metagenome]|uniref:Uncharacterized protein n=1 Tax=bioreactor metagenome TaxID=1076179 RepID=A0A645EDY7_9ZZZZ
MMAAKENKLKIVEIKLKVRLPITYFLYGGMNLLNMEKTLNIVIC